MINEGFRVQGSGLQGKDSREVGEKLNPES
jgi:hypothetical protein